MIRFEVSHIKAIREVLAEEGDLNCDFNVTRNLRVYLNEDNAQEVKKAYHEMVSQGISNMDDVLFTTGKNAEGVS